MNRTQKETQQSLEDELRSVLAAYREGGMELEAMAGSVSRLVARILRLRTEQLLTAMKFVGTLEEINDAVMDEGRRATRAEKIDVDRQLARLERLLLGVSAMSQDN